MSVPRFTLEVPVEPADIDENEHVSNLVYVRWVLDAARAHSDAEGFDHAAYRRLGGIFIVRRQEVDYLLPARLGDRIAVTTRVEPWKRVSCSRHTEIQRVGEDRMLARAVTHWVFVSFETGRPTKIPDALVSAFS
ncbi:MAG: thioesterase family protein [Myxococcota bacterium]